METAKYYGKVYRELNKIFSEDGICDIIFDILYNNLEIYCIRCKYPLDNCRCCYNTFMVSLIKVLILCAIGAINKLVKIV